VILVALLFLGSAVLAAFMVYDQLAGPDPDLWDRDAPMCKCGVRDGARHHIHASWTERKPR
jgi:hypothetical protein